MLYSCGIGKNREREAFRCRRTFSIVGIDNSNLAELSQTPLTSLENPAEELGRAAAEKIAACVKHGVKMDTQEFDPRLVIRNSVRMKTGEERKEEHAGTIKERSL